MPRKKKSQSEPYLVIPRRTIRSKELNSLSVHSRWIYVVLCTEWNRIEDSDFMFPYKQIQDITGFEPHRISACLTELIKAGFIEKENYGGLLRNPNTYKMNSATWLYLRDTDEFQLKHTSIIDYNFNPDKYVYIIRYDTHVKIGKANNVQKRFSSLKGMSHTKIELLWYANETESINEQSLHALFNKHRSHNEYFEYSTEIKDFIESHRN